MASATTRRLPALLRAWGVLGRRAAPERQLAVAGRLGNRLLAPGRRYRASGNYVVELDREDPFQVAMAIGLFDRGIQNILSRYARHGAIVIDAGAHLGYFTSRMAHGVGPTGEVHAFEPDPRIYPRLCRHLEINGLTWVFPHECGLLDRRLEAQELSIPRQLGWASIVQGAGGATEVVRVPMVTLDEYVEEHRVDPRRVSLIKLDVEGAELQALRGAAWTLRSSDAAVVVEHIPQRMRSLGQDPAELLALMWRHGYSPWAPTQRFGRLSLKPDLSASPSHDVLFLKR